MHFRQIRTELSRHVFWKGNHHMQSTRRAPAITLGVLRVCSDCSLRRSDLSECPAGQKAPGQSAGRCFGCLNHSGRQAQRQEQSSGPLGLGAQASSRNMPVAGAHESQCTLYLHVGFQLAAGVLFTCSQQQQLALFMQEAKRCSWGKVSERKQTVHECSSACETWFAWSACRFGVQLRHCSVEFGRRLGLTIS